MAERPGLCNYGDYFDIMVIGNTGVGKTTTADKLLLANPTNHEYVYTPPGEGDSANTKDRGNSASYFVNDSDLTMWKTSSEQDLENLETRLKNLVFIRQTSTNCHEEINTKRADSQATTVCELISNDTSKIRVLDVPGFFSLSNQTSSCDTLGHMEAVTTNSLAIMRSILHIKLSHHFKFDRIVYFLPEKGVLQRDTEILKSNIWLMMESYFGKSIFTPMIVVATHDKYVYDIAIPGLDLYPPKCMEITRENFQKAMSSVVEDIPTPPIVFLSFLSTCEEVLSLFQKTIVHGTGVELEFSNSKCIRCNITIQRAMTRGSQKKQDLRNQDREDSICRYPNTEELPIPYYESTCHPMLIPKHTILRKIAGGTVRMISMGLADKEKWPSFSCEDEKCIHCGAPPGTRGCKRVGSEYNYNGGSLKVDHSHNVQENLVIINNN